MEVVEALEAEEAMAAPVEVVAAGLEDMAEASVAREELHEAASEDEDEGMLLTERQARFSSASIAGATRHATPFG